MKNLILVVILLLLFSGCGNNNERPKNTQYVSEIFLESTQPIAKHKLVGTQTTDTRLVAFGRDMNFRARVNHPTGDRTVSNDNWTVECCVISYCPKDPVTPVNRKDAFARACSGASTPPGGMANGNRCKGAQQPSIFPITAQNGVANLKLYCTRQRDDQSIDEQYKWEGSNVVLNPVLFCLRMYIGKENGVKKYIYSPVYAWYGGYSLWKIDPSRPANYFSTGFEITGESGEIWWANQTANTPTNKMGTNILAALPPECDCVPYADSDLDGAPNCADSCPQDEWKSQPGICGCGISDSSDVDSDGVIDCLDACPLDPRSTEYPCPTWGDTDADEDVDMVDFGNLQQCITCPTYWGDTPFLTPECRWWDADFDGKVLMEVEGRWFENCSNGPGVKSDICKSGPITN